MLILFLSLCAGSATFSVAYLIVERELDAQKAKEAGLADDQRASLRKKRAKRSNERLKLASTFSNGLGVAVIATSVLAPMASDRAVTPRGALLAALIALISHLVGQSCSTSGRVRIEMDGLEVLALASIGASLVSAFVAWLGSRAFDNRYGSPRPPKDQ